MKSIFLIILVIITVSAFADDYPPEGWTTDIKEAIIMAEKENKMLLLDFSGSDWCYWCKKLESEVFYTKEFQDWSEDNLVKVFLDFPQNIELTDDIKRQNQVLQEYFGVSGFPTIFILSSNLEPLLRTGYKEGGPQNYIQHIKEDRNLKVDSAETFNADFKRIIETYIGPF